MSPRHRCLGVRIGLLTVIAGLILFIVSLSTNYEDIHIYYLENLQMRSVPRNSSVFQQSTCSVKTKLRGARQRVLAYAVYGQISDPQVMEKYVKMLKETVMLTLPQLYPGWIVRIYHDSKDKESEKILQQLFLNETNHVDLCDVGQTIKEWSLGRLHPMTWRFLPLLDADVDFMMSRDADSPVIQREVDAVQEWLESNRTFHVMRDHYYHNFHILGGMWGVKLKENRSSFVRAAENLFSTNHYMEHFYDQRLLWKHLWPVARSSMMAHDSYFCRDYESSVPFPTRRVDRKEFVGMVGNAKKESEQLPECPQECRPQHHPNWIYC